ncbi:MAG: hypothetical protein AAB834_07855 [Patescibacteria group bacterium]
MIDTIDQINTPGQMEGLARFLQQAGGIGKIAVVSGLAHTPRVGRYLEHYKGLFEGVEFVNLPVPMPETPHRSGIIMGELRRIATYARAGHLAERSYFSSPDREA